MRNYRHCYLGISRSYSVELVDRLHCYSLAALSGRVQVNAERVKIQGPYRVRAQALAARSTVAAYYHR